MKYNKSYNKDIKKQKVDLLKVPEVVKQGFYTDFRCCLVFLRKPSGPSSRKTKHKTLPLYEWSY